MTVEEGIFNLNSVLCYICSARNSLDKDIIIASVFNFYDQKEITEAKNLVFSYTKSDPRRRAGEGKTIRDITDILEVLSEIYENNIKIPTFVTKKWNSLPPPNSEFGPLSRNVTHLSEMIYSLGDEMKKQNEKSNNSKDCEEHLLDIKEDIIDIKKCQIIQQQTATTIKQDILKLSKIRPSDSSESSKFLSQVSRNVHLPITNNNLFSNVASALPLPTLNYTNNPRKRISPSPDIDSAQLSDDEVKIVSPPENSDEGWTLVDSRRKRKNFRNNSIVGTGNFNEEAGFSSAPRSLDLFIGGCSLNTRPEDISAFCDKKHNIKVKVTDMNSKSEFRKSFKVTVDSNNRDALLDTNKWPQGVLVRKFTIRRNQNTFDAIGTNNK